MDKKILMPLALALATWYLFNTYFSKQVTQPEQSGVVTIGHETNVTAGQPVKVPTTQELYKPLLLDVDFAPTKFSGQEHLVNVQTDYCNVTLSTYGAVISTLDFKDHAGKSGTPLRTIYNKGSFEEEQRKKGCFLLALDQQTPYQYTLVEKREDNEGIHVIFKAENSSWVINKSYFFHKDSYQIDLALQFDAKKDGEAKVVTPRLLFAAPIVAELDDDTVSVISWNETKNTIETTEITKNKKLDLAWFWHSNKPMFGAQDRYFVHTLIGDENKFVQRAYVKEFYDEKTQQYDTKNVISILEGPALQEKGQWKLSFYMGPKVFDHFNNVDDRLEELLSFGWLSWLCKLLLKLLSYIYDYIGNFGLAIIVMTIILKLPFMLPTMYARKKMEEYQYYIPSIQKIRTKYRHDMRLQHEELMKFYRDHNLSPTTQFVGCLPLLIQMPILFALYRVLNNYLDLYQAPFFGWIVDLSAKDPFYVLPILMGISMLWQNYNITPGSDEKQRFVMFFMSIVMTVVFASFPAGLVLYWFMNNLLTIGEDYLRKYLFK